MGKVNIANLYSTVSLLHVCTHVVPCSISQGQSCENINLHVMRHGILPHEIVYTTRDLAMKISYVYNPQEQLLTHQVTICDQILEKPPSTYTTSRHTFHHQAIAAHID